MEDESKTIWSDVAWAESVEKKFHHEKIDWDSLYREVKKVETGKPIVLGLDERLVVPIMGEDDTKIKSCDEVEDIFKRYQNRQHITNDELIELDKTIRDSFVSLRDLSCPRYVLILRDISNNMCKLESLGNERGLHSKIMEIVDNRP
jgi:hypothetical protein